MSELNSRATVDLLINGQQAQQTLNQLRQNALQLETAIAKAAASGNKADLRRLRKELTDTKRQIREMESATQQVEHVLRNLNKATPRELNQALQTLNRQLNYMERGSEAWNAHVEKIKRVKMELAAVNREMREQEGFWTRFNRKMNDWQTTMMAGIAAFSGFIMAGRNAVKAFAEMDEQLANTRKYTGMTEEDVLKLNEAFKKMDTRTSREQLNELAQEAGRLGKNTLEDVQGYVEAADIINVALAELGEGATQTIAKLTDIFGVTELMGTKDAMLAVGSTVNVLSQNCTASKPYLVQFAQRMAGVGAQAKLSIPELLAFGATLDANGQKVEMSSSALGKLTMNLFQKPMEIARQVGIDAEKFNETLKRSTYEGLMMFLQRIHDLGSADGLAVLAPMFKDLGMDGVRMSQVLSTLADHLDMVKWETREANKAFTEATSASNEYKIFNNTVQAGLDKARKRVKELAVELGEKLLPIMRHVYTSTSVMLRLLSAITSFIIKYRVAIVSAAAAFVTYKTAMNLATIAAKAHHAWMVLCQKAAAAYHVVLKGLHTMHLLLQMGIAKLTGNWARQSALMLDLKKNAMALKNVYALMAAAVVAAVTALVMYIREQNTEAKVQKMLNGIKEEAAKNAVEEKMHIEQLVAAARNETLSMQERTKAVNELNRIIPGYNALLDKTSGKYRENKKALDDYINSLIRKYEIEGARDTLQQIGKEKAEIRIQKEETEKQLKEERQRQQQGRNANTPRTSGGAVAPAAVHEEIGNAATVQVLERQIEKRERELKVIEEKEKRITEIYGKEMQQMEVSEIVESEATDGDTSTGSLGDTTTGDTGGGGHEKHFAREMEWKEKEEAMNRIAYAKGEKDYLQYTRRIAEIEAEFNERKLKHTDLTENERLSIQAAYSEALKKLSAESVKVTVEEENAEYNEKVAVEKQRYIDGKVSHVLYTEVLEQLEIEHLERMTHIYEEGSKEQLQAQKALQDKLVANRQRHQKEVEAAEKKHRDAMDKLKADVFGDNPVERKVKYNADLALLKEVYDREILAAGDNAKEKLRIEKAFQKARIALMEKYNIEGGKKNRFLMQQWNEDVVKFLDSEYGEAVKGSLDVLVSGMGSIFQQLTTIVEAELEVQTAGIEKKYEREISLAEGNNYKVKRLEKQREKEIAQAKNEANKKMFAMQVIQAVAQTATNALNAYGSAAQVPMIGYILAPIAAATAVAAGMLQVAAIKKQQQASEAQGYAAGGFTPEGAVDEPVGIVHAGEWVASQSLVRNPHTRPVIEALEYAQRNNVRGFLSPEDVSRTITAPSVLAKSFIQAQERPQQVVVQNMEGNMQDSRVFLDYAETMRLLRQRLDEPFLTVNTVTGDTGMKQAQDEYERLIRNKTPKSRR